MSKFLGNDPMWATISSDRSIGAINYKLDPDSSTSGRHEHGNLEQVFSSLKISIPVIRFDKAIEEAALYRHLHGTGAKLVRGFHNPTIYDEGNLISLSEFLRLTVKDGIPVEMSTPGVVPEA